MPITLETKDIDSLIQELGRCTTMNPDAAAQIFNARGLLAGSLQTKYIPTVMIKKSDRYDNLPKSGDDTDGPSLMGHALSKTPPIRKIYKWDPDGVRTVKPIYDASKSDIYDELHRYDIEGPIPETAYEKYSNVQSFKVSDLKAEATRRGLTLKSSDKKADVIAALIRDDNIDPRIEELWARPYFELRKECGVAGLDIETKKFTKQAFVAYLIERAVPMATTKVTDDRARLDKTRSKMLLVWCDSKKLSAPKTKDKNTLIEYVVEHRDGEFWNQMATLIKKKDPKRKKERDSSDY